ncbi:MAG: CotH kinase family protein [Kiritimatiellae bacterium]|nr:CotH kinase family protein [Kiritimatiellia bacterium]
MNTIKHSLFLLVAFGVLNAFAAFRANTPAARLDTWWTARHAEKVAALSDSSVKKDIVFIGDELTQGWETTGASSLASHFAGDKAMFNLGFNGDCTENVLWRIQNGELGSPKAIFLMVGGNNSAIYTEKEEPEGKTYLAVRAIIDYLLTNFGTSKIIVQAVLPRGLDESDPLRPRNDRLNIDVRAYAQKKGCSWVDMSDLFLESDHHTLKTSLFNADRATLNASGYEVWAQAVSPYVNAAASGSAMPADLVATARPEIDRITTFPTATNADLQDAFWRKFEDDVKLIGENGRSCDIVLLGDSLTQKWMEGNSATSMNGLGGNVLNLGRTGDFVENLLWRLKSGCIDGYTTKFFNLLIGTNNTIGKNPSEDPADIAAGVRAVLDLVLEKHPESKVLLMPIIPYGYTNAQNSAKGAAHYANNQAANEIIRTFADGQRVILVDVRSQFMNADGTYKGEMYLQGNGDYPDQFLHLTTKAYEEILAPAISSVMATAGASSVALPTIGSAAAQVSGTNATIALSGVAKGTDASGAAASSFTVSYKLDASAEVALSTTETGSSASVQFNGLGDGWHTCAVWVSSDGIVKSAVKRVKFLVDSQADAVGWKVAPMDATGSAFRSDGTQVFARGYTGHTVNGVSFSAGFPGSDQATISPSSYTGAGWTENNPVFNGGWVWEKSDSSLDLAFTLQGLTAGKKYLVQILAANHWNNSSTTISAGDLSPLEATKQNDYKCGAVITRVFEATGAQETVTVTFATTGSKCLVKAIQLRELGEGSGSGGEGGGGEGGGGEGGGATVVAPSIGTASATTSDDTATISLSNIEMGTDDEGATASSYSIAYSLNGASAVTALSNQSGASASFQIAGLADGSYTCTVTITTDKNKTATKSVSFAIATSSQGGGGGGEPGPTPQAGWTAGPMASDGSTIRTDGTLLYAYSFSGGTVGGVTFTKASDFTSAAMVSASPTPTGSVNSDFQNAGVSGDFGHMLEGGWYWGYNGAASGELSFSLTLKGLTTGRTYLVQLVSHRTSNSTLVSVNGSTPVHIHGTHDGVNYNYGGSIVGVFTATDATASFTVTYSAASSGMRPLNAIQVRDLGEGGGGGGEDPIDPVDPTTPVCMLTIPEKTGLQLQSVTTNGVAVAAVGGSYSIVSNTQVTVTFSAASGYEIVSGNPVVFTVSGAKTFADADYPVVQTTSGGGDDPVVPPVGLGWTATPMSASGDTICTTGALVYAYARRTGTVNAVPFAGLGDKNLSEVYNNVNFSFDVDMYRDMNSDSADPYQNLIGHRWVSSSTGARTLTLKGLSTGKTYLVQLILNMQDSFAAGARFTAPGDVTARANGEGWENGGSLVGVFVAGGDTETFSLVSSVYTVLSAIQVRELPEEAPEVDPADIATSCMLRISEVMPKPTDALDRGALEGMDVNGLESGWVEVENTSDKWADLADYRFIRVNRGKKTDTAGAGNFPRFLVKPHGHAVFYTSERYSNSKDRSVSAFEHGTFDGKPMVMGDSLRGVLVWGDKVNPKKSPFVRLYYAPGGEISNVVDTVVVPSDLPEGWSIIVGDAAEGEGTRRWMCPTPTRGTANSDTTGLRRIGPNVGPVYEKADKKKTDLASEFAAPVPPAVPGTDYAVVLPINPVMNPDGSSAPRAADAIASIKFVYRKDLDDATLVTNAVDMSTLDASDKNWGARYTATIPASYFPAAGHLRQWKVLVTDGEGVEWTSPSFNNKDDGYEWYGTIIEPGADLVSEHLPTWHMFADPQSVAQMDYDKDDKQHYTLANGARVAIYDASTSNYYDYVRIDLRGNTSANFTKKSHGLRFAKAHPLTMTDVVTGETIDGIRKTSLTSEYADPSKLRQMMAFWLWRRMGNNAPFHFPVRCNLNGQFYQLAFNTERFTDELIEDVYGLDKYGYGYKNVGTMKSGSGTLAGDIEKKTPDDEDESNITVLQNELRGPIYELGVQNVSGSTAAALSSEETDPTGLDNAPLTKFVVQKFDLPAWLNYLASARITQEMDDVWANICVYYDNPEMKEGARGTGTWMPLGYDFNETFGQFYRDAGLGQNGISSTDDWFKSHPLYGGHRIQCYTSSAMTTTMAAAAGRDYSNYGIESVLQSTKFRRLFLRRLRTLMDQELKEPGTAESDTPVMAKMREMVALMSADAAADSAKWPIDSSAQAIDVWPSSSRPATISAGVDDIWNNYVVPRREHLYVTHSVTNTAKAVGYGSRLNAGIPEAQSPIETLAPNITVDLSGLADGVVVISNGNNEVVDMSGWTLKTAVEWTLPAGTVCDAQDAIYVVADRRAYVAAHSDALTDQVIVGNATFSDTAVLQIFAPDGTTQVLTTEPDIGDSDQANLRFHTIYGSTLNGGGDLGEFIVITNVSASAVNLEGVEISCGKAGSVPKCKIVLGDVDLSAYGSLRLDQADYANVGWTKITNGSIAIKIIDKTGAVVQLGELTFGLCDARTDEGGYALQATRFDNETPLADSTDDWTAVFVEAAAPDAPVIGGEGVASPIVVGSDKVSITISNAASGHTYGYRKSTTLAGLKDATVVYFANPAAADGILTLEIPKAANEPSCFYQIVVE